MRRGAWRIKASLLKKEFECGGELRRQLLRFTQALIIQAEQNVANQGEKLIRPAFIG